MIGWYLGVLGIIIGMIGGSLFLNSLKHLKGNLRKSTYYLVVASLIYIVFSSIMVALGIMKYDITKRIWEVVPVLFFISASAFAIGANKFIWLLKKI